MTVPAPAVDDVFDAGVPECDDHRGYTQLWRQLMVVWDCSKPAAQRRMDDYTLEQCEWLVRDYFTNGRWRGGERA